MLLAFAGLVWGGQDYGDGKSWLRRTALRLLAVTVAELCEQEHIRRNVVLDLQFPSAGIIHFALLQDTMDSPKDEKKHAEHSSDSQYDDVGHSSGMSSHQDTTQAVEQEKATESPSGVLGKFSILGNLPEWDVPGIGLLQGKLLNSAIAWTSCLAFLMFGYDQGVMSSLLTLNDFQRHFPLMTPLSQANDICWTDSPTNTVRNERMCTGDANTQAAAVALYQIGCFLGAVLILFYGETWGRKSSTFWGSLIMIIGTIFQVAAGGASGGDAGAYAILIVGRVVGGVGNGMVTSSKSHEIMSQIQKSKY